MLPNNLKAALYVTYKRDPLGYNKIPIRQLKYHLFPIVRFQEMVFLLVFLFLILTKFGIFHSVCSKKIFIFIIEPSIKLLYSIKIMISSRNPLAIGVFTFSLYFSI